MRSVLISTYEMGRQPFGLASAAAWLRREGWDVTPVDVAKEPLEDDTLASADLIAFHLPMHTATRLAGAGHRSGSPPESVRAPLRVRVVCAAQRGLAAVARRGRGARRRSSRRTWRRSRAGDGGRQERKRAGRGASFLRGPDGLRSNRRPLAAFTSSSPIAPGCRRSRGTRRCRCPTAAPLVGYTEASRGCRHLCRHCPVVPIYEGQFRVVQPDVVLADVAAQVAAGRRAHHVRRSRFLQRSDACHADRVGAARRASVRQLRRDDQGRTSAAAIAISSRGLRRPAARS